MSEGFKFRPFCKIADASVLEAWDGVWDDLMEMGEEYCGEAGYDYTFNAENAAQSFRNCIDVEDFDLIMLFGPGELAGFAVVSYNSPWMDEIIANQTLFYIRPKYRNFVFPSTLLDFSIQRCDDLGVKYTFSGTLSRITDRITLGYEAMLTRKGFNPITRHFIREGE